MPSCMRAPPEVCSKITGRDFSVAFSHRIVMFSPTTEPILPPMKPNTKEPYAMARPLSADSPMTMASRKPVFF